MLYREIIAVCSEIHTKHINTLCGQNVELLNVKMVVHIVTTGLYKWHVVSNAVPPAISSDFALSDEMLIIRLKGEQNLRTS
jgi:hypothetical protein